MNSWFITLNRATFAKSIDFVEYDKCYEIKIHVCKDGSSMKDNYIATG